jgi:RES domain-containing protein
MLKQPALGQAIASLRPRAIGFSGVGFRSIHLRHFSNFTTVQPLHAAGGGLAGSRYVLPGGPASLYMAFDAETAHLEGNQVFYQTSAASGGPALRRSGGLRPDPVVILGIFVNGSKLLDLTNSNVQQTLKLTKAALLGPWLGVPSAPTQVLGEAIFQDGHFAGIIYPSAQNLRHKCLCVFPARLNIAPLATTDVDFRDVATGLAAHLP